MAHYSIGDCGGCSRRGLLRTGGQFASQLCPRCLAACDTVHDLLAQAIEAGRKEFVFDGETFPVSSAFTPELLARAMSRGMGKERPDAQEPLWAVATAAYLELFGEAAEIPYW